ncbi:MAG: hypothetical protein IPJ07_24145 [Acidobacteria bacterium]|nr:hypothetical protein [Acidobacteriota bacterium]
MTPNDQAHLPGGLGELHLWNGLHARRVRCSDWFGRTAPLPQVGHGLDGDGDAEADEITAGRALERRATHPPAHPANSGRGSLSDRLP